MCLRAFPKVKSVTATRNLKLPDAAFIEVWCPEQGKFTSRHGHTGSPGPVLGLHFKNIGKLEYIQKRSPSRWEEGCGKCLKTMRE